MRAFLGIGVSLLLVFSLIFVIAESAGWTEHAWIGARIGEFRDWSDRDPLASAALFVALLASDLVLPVPSSVTMGASGYLLGAALGTAASTLGAMLGALAGFGLCRAFGQSAFRRLVGDTDFTRVESLFERWGSWVILLSRPVPMLTEIVSCLAGLSGMSLAQFAALSLAGTLPLCAVYAWGGAFARPESRLGAVLLLALVIPAAGFALTRWLARAARRP